MRPDQLVRLKDLSEKLVEVFLGEADPDFWPGAGQDHADMDQQTRGDRYWVKKNAVATAALIRNVEAMSQPANAPAVPNDEAEREADLDRQVADAEKEAERVLKEAQRLTKGAGKRATGKA